MRKPSIEDMFSGKESKYPLVIAVAKRAREITEEANQTGEIILEKPVKLAIKEFKENRYQIFEPEVMN